MSFASVRRLGLKLGAPVISQGLTAGTSLLLQMIAAHALGLTGYGAFAIFLAVLVTATALYTGYVGDSLAVLDRHDERTRAVLVTSALSALGLSLFAAVGTSLVLRPGEMGTALVYAALVVGWLLEETFRRLLIARQEFWRLVVNDLTYLVGTIVVLGIWYLGVEAITLKMLFASMAVGTVVAVLTGLVQVPRTEIRQLRPGVTGFGSVAKFAGWRSLHAVLRPAALLAARVLVANLISLAAVGVMEAARLVVAPLQVVINGAGSFLLAGFAAEERKGHKGASGLAAKAAWLLTGITLFGGLVMTLFAGPLGELMADQPVDPWLLLGWVAYLGAWAAGLPYVTELVARKLSREVFWVRFIDSALGLGFVVTGLLCGVSIVAVPWLLTIGGLYSVLRLRILALRTRETLR